MSEDPNLPSPGDPEKPPEWIAPLVRSIMAAPPIEGSAAPLICPVCDCDHQQFKGIGVFHPTEDGTKLVTVFPTAGGMASVDLPPDIKVGNDTLYVRYECLCNGHNWAVVMAWHDDHTVVWQIELDKTGLPVTTSVPPAAQAQGLKKTLPSTAEMMKGIQAEPNQPSDTPILDQIKNLLQNPIYSQLTGGALTPILVLPTPVIVPLALPGLGSILETKPSTLKAALKNSMGTPKKHPAPPVPKAPVPPPAPPTKADLTPTQKAYVESPTEAAAWWTSWDHVLSEEKTLVMLPVFPPPHAKKPHFYVADKTKADVVTRKDWIIRMALDVPEDVARLVWAYILWHDRLIVILNVSKYTEEQHKAIIEGVTKTLVAHNALKVHGMGLYKKADYVKLTTPKT